MIFFSLLITTLLLSLSAYLLGFGALRLIRIDLTREDVFLSLFLKLLVGCCMLSVGYAAVKTGVETVLLPIPVFLYVAFRQAGLNRKLPSIESQPEKWRTISAEIGLLLLIGLPLFIFRWWLHFEPESPYLNVPFQDYIYYARLAEVHNTFGVESTNLNSGSQAIVYVQPYHYFDLWINALLVYLTDIPSVWTLCISTYAFFLLIAASGIGAIIRFFGVSYGWAVLAAILVLAINGVEFPVFSQWSVTAQGHLMMALSFSRYPKTAPVYLFLGLVILLLLRKRWLAASWTLACTPLAYTTVLPSLSVGLFLLAGTLVVFGRLTFKNALYLLLPMVLSGVYTIIFYIAHPGLPDVSPAINLAALETFLPQGIGLRTLINIFVGSLLNYVVFYFIYLVILVVIIIRWPNLIKDYKVLFLGFLCVLIAASVFRAVTTRNIESWQFISTIIIPLSSVLFSVVVGFALGRLRWLGKLSLVGSLALIVGFTNRTFWSDKSGTAGTQRFSPKFLLAARTSLPPSGLGGYLFAVSDYHSVYTMNTDAHISGTYIYGLSNGYSSVSLSVLDAAPLRNISFLKDSARIDYVVAKSALYKFRAKLQQQGRYYSSDSLKYKFVRQNKLAFICASAAARLPDILSPLVDKTIVDSYSGEKLYILKKYNE